jgi:hypothetical protein
VAVLLLFVAAPANAAPSAEPPCANGYCVWSQENYAGTELTLRIPGLNQCFTPSGDNFDAIRSAVVTGEAYYLVFYANADCTGSSTSVMYQRVLAFDSPKRGIKAFINRF